MLKIFVKRRWRKTKVTFHRFMDTCTAEFTADFSQFSLCKIYFLAIWVNVGLKFSNTVQVFVKYTYDQTSFECRRFRARKRGGLNYSWVVHVPRSWMGFYYQQSGNRLLNCQIYYFCIWKQWHLRWSPFDSWTFVIAHIL